MKFFPERLRFRQRRNPSSTSSHQKAILDGAVHDGESTEHSASSSTAVVAVEQVTAPASKDTPPVDDCCPICFGTFSVPCKAPCGHWYCGGCIMQYWKYCSTTALQPCKCPMCSRRITCLTLEASLFQQQQEDDVTEVLKKVEQYNRLFIGGLYGCYVRVVESPLYFRRVWQDLLDPDRNMLHLKRLRRFAMVIGILYSLCPFDFLHIGELGPANIVHLFESFVIVLCTILYLVGVYRVHTRDQRARGEMPANEL